MTILLNASQNPIKAVTVFSSRKAEVIRTFAVELAEGQNELAITALPSCIDTESARVTGLGEAVLFDVVCTVADPRDEQLDTDNDALKALERRRGVLEGEKALRGRAADILVQYGRTLTAEYTSGDVVHAFLDSLVQRGSTTLGEIEQVDAQIAEVEKEIEKEKRRLQKDRRKAAARARVSAVIMAKRAGKVEITLTYMVSDATWSPSYDLRATTEDGKPSRTVSLHYRASIQQNTGEDWRDTAVSVSTATPGGWTTIPGLRSMKILPSLHGTSGLFGSKQTNQVKPSAFGAFGTFGQNQNTGFAGGGLFGQPNAQQPIFGQPQTNNSNTGTSVFGQPGPVGAAQANNSNIGTALFGASTANTTSTGLFGASNRSADRAASVPPPDISPPADVADGWTAVEVQGATDPGPARVADDKDVAWAETKAVVTESAVASAFRIDGNCTIPSEQTAHRVAIAILSFDAKVNYIAVPRSAPIAFLQCEVKNTSEYRLLPGPVNVFLDNSPVSKTSIQDVNPDEVFKCTLGPDPSLRIKCARLPRTVASSGSAFAAQTTVTTYKLCTSVRNAHGFPVKGLLVRDAAPDATQPSENANVPRIKVVLKRPEGLGEAAPGALVDVATGSSSDACSVKVRWGRGGGDKEGKYVWVVDVGAGEEVKLEAEYEVRAPADFMWQLREDFFR